jgi:hypothetical protein
MVLPSSLLGFSISMIQRSNEIFHKRKDPMDKVVLRTPELLVSVYLLGDGMGEVEGEKRGMPP